MKCVRIDDFAPSPEQLARNSARNPEAEERCIVCDLPITTTDPYMIEMSTRRELALEGEFTERDSQGEFPIGPNCLKKARFEPTAPNVTPEREIVEYLAQLRKYGEKQRPNGHRRMQTPDDSFHTLWRLIDRAREIVGNA